MNERKIQKVLMNLEREKIWMKKKSVGMNKERKNVLMKKDEWKCMYEWICMDGWMKIPDPAPSCILVRIIVML